MDPELLGIDQSKLILNMLKTLLQGSTNFLKSKYFDMNSIRLNIADVSWPLLEFETFSALGIQNHLLQMYNQVL